MAICISHMYTHISRPETEEGTECSEHTDTRSTALHKEKNSFKRAERLKAAGRDEHGQHG